MISWLGKQQQTKKKEVSKGIETIFTNISFKLLSFFKFLYCFSTFMVQINPQYGDLFSFIHLFSFIYWNSRINHQSLEDSRSSKERMLMSLSAPCLGDSRCTKMPPYNKQWSTEKISIHIKMCCHPCGDTNSKTRDLLARKAIQTTWRHFHFSYLQRHNEDKEKASSGLWGNNCWIPEKVYCIRMTHSTFKADIKEEP